VLEVDPFPNREVHLLQRIQALLNFAELVLSINVVDRIVEGLQIAEVSVNFSKVVRSLNGVYRTLESFQSSHLGFYFCKLVFPIYRVNWPTQCLQVRYQVVNLVEVVAMLNRIDRPT